MRTTLVSIPTDTVPLDGAWYLPTRGVVRGAVLLCHGNTMNFYTGAPRFLPPHLTRLGYACLAFNRRGHDILTIRESRAPHGAAFQTAAEGLADTEYAARYLAERGYPSPIVIGHSNGGMLAAQFAATHPETRGLALLSAHAGGVETVRRACAEGQLAADRLPQTLAEAERLVADGRGRELLLLPGWWYVLSAESFVDRMYHTPDTLAAASRIRCPTLYLRGDQESPTIYPAEEFARRHPGPCDVVIVPACDHFYRGREETVAEAVVAWLSRRLRDGERCT